MANIEITFRADSIMRLTTFQMFLPNDVPSQIREGNPAYGREPKTLFLLHGYSGFYKDWALGSLAHEMAMKYNLAVVMPSGDNSFYVDGKGIGHSYARYVGSELVDYVRATFGLATEERDTFICGFSMGGFGAIHLGMQYPQNFGKIAALSAAMIVDDISELKPGERDAIADYDYYTSVFGELSELKKSKNNPEYQIKLRKQNQECIQPIFMACGTQDYLLRHNRKFYEFLVGEGVDVTYRESPGSHDWTFWNEYLEPAVLWMLNARD